jgi:hypothetical protein
MKFVTTIAKYSVPLLIIMVAWNWLCFYSDFNVPEFLPYTPIKLYGLVFVVFTIAVLIIGEKALLKLEPNIGLWNLTILGLAICLSAEVEFQIFLSFTYDSDKIYHFIHAIIVTSFYDAAISFFVAFQLKTRRTKMLLLYIVTVLITFRGLLYLFPAIIKH